MPSAENLPRMGRLFHIDKGDVSLDSFFSKAYRESATFIYSSR